MTRILIMGTGGRLGRLLWAARSGSRVQAAEWLFQSRSAGRDICWHPDQDMSRLPSCDVIVGLWGVTSGNEAELGQNTSLARLTRRLALHLGARGMIHLSSAAVYGPGNALSETSTPKPQNAYGRAKLAMEQALLADEEVTDSAEPAQIMLRLANIVGADSLAPALAGQRPAVLHRFEDGRGPVRSYLGAPNLLTIILGLASQAPSAWPDVLNVAAPYPIEMEHLLQAAGRPITWQDAPQGVPQEVTLDVTRQTQLLRDACPSSDPWTLVKEWQALETPA